MSKPVSYIVYSSTSGYFSEYQEMTETVTFFYSTEFYFTDSTRYGINFFKIMNLIEYRIRIYKNYATISVILVK